MPFSDYLNKHRSDCKELVKELRKHYDYVSVLGTDVRAMVYRADRNSSTIREGAGECGFVVKMHNGNVFFEYSITDISGDKQTLAERILRETAVSSALTKPTIQAAVPDDKPLVKDFLRESDFERYDDEELISEAKDISELGLRADEKVLNCIVILQPYTVSKLFVTENQELSQHYGWVNGIAFDIYKGEKLVQERVGAYGNQMAECLTELKQRIGTLAHKCDCIAGAKPIKPGIYDCITDSSITGLIAHEAFGHGVEMDQFVKDRALAKSFMGEYVASPITSMHDGASAAFSAASYFFDDDGVLAHDTQIIKDGILQAGLSDLTSACQLGTEPTGNGRRESYKRKCYTRMTNTFFEAGTDKLSDMIASIDHGYMLFETNNGMEDPKNWQIQCTCEYGIEIEHGKLTDRYVSPVVMSGSVPELLKSITMVSDTAEVHGEGSCGKGYKEWVRVADGGANLKVKVKLS